MGGIHRMESLRRAEDACYDSIIPPGEGWMYELLPAQVLRIVDVEGNQAVDTLCVTAVRNGRCITAVTRSCASCPSSIAH